MRIGTSKKRSYGPLFTCFLFMCMCIFSVSSVASADILRQNDSVLLGMWKQFVTGPENDTQMSPAQIEVFEAQEKDNPNCTAVRYECSDEEKETIRNIKKEMLDISKKILTQQAESAKIQVDIDALQSKIAILQDERRLLSGWLDQADKEIAVVTNYMNVGANIRAALMMLRLFKSRIEKTIEGYEDQSTAFAGEATVLRGKLKMNKKVIEKLQEKYEEAEGRLAEILLECDC